MVASQLSLSVWAIFCPSSSLHTHTHIHIYCTYTDAQFLPLSLTCTYTLVSLVGDHCLSPLIDCLPGITFQTINTIKNPLKPLKPQRTSNHLTIKTHRKKKKKLASPVRSHKQSLFSVFKLLKCKKYINSLYCCRFCL